MSNNILQAQTSRIHFCTCIGLSLRVSLAVKRIYFNVAASLLILCQLLCLYIRNFNGIIPVALVLVNVAA